MACVWLATKLEEVSRRMREVLSVFYRLDRRRHGKPNLPPLDVYGSVRFCPYRCNFCHALFQYLCILGWLPQAGMAAAALSVTGV